MVFPICVTYCLICVCVWYKKLRKINQRTIPLLVWVRHWLLGYNNKAPTITEGRDQRESTKTKNCGPWWTPWRKIILQVGKALVWTVEGMLAATQFRDKPINKWTENVHKKFSKDTKASRGKKRKVPRASSPEASAKTTPNVFLSSLLVHLQWFCWDTQ